MKLIAKKKKKKNTGGKKSLPESTFEQRTLQKTKKSHNNFCKA